MLYIAVFLVGCLVGYWLPKSRLFTIKLQPPTKKCDHPAVHFSLPESGLPRQMWCHMCGMVNIDKEGWVRPTIELRKKLKTPIPLSNGMKALFAKIDLNKKTND